MTRINQCIGCLAMTFTAHLYKPTNSAYSDKRIKNNNDLVLSWNTVSPGELQSYSLTFPKTPSMSASIALKKVNKEWHKLLSVHDAAMHYKQ